MNKAGPWVETRETWGLFCKMYRPNRYLRFKAVRSRSGGSSLMGSRSNLGRCLQIGRPRVKGARCGGGRPPEQSSAMGGGSPGLAKPAPQGSIRPGFGSRMLVGVRVIHLEARLSSAGFWTTRARAAAVLRGGARRRAGAEWLWTRIRLGFGRGASARQGKLVQGH